MKTHYYYYRTLRKFENKYSYTYLGDKDTLGFKCAKFKFKSINAATKQNINQMGMDMVVDSEMDIQGFLLLDLNDGICVNSTSKIEGEVRAAISGQYSQMTNSSINSTIEITREVK